MKLKPMITEEQIEQVTQSWLAQQRGLQEVLDDFIVSFVALPGEVSTKNEEVECPWEC